MNADIAQTVERLQALVDFVDFYPLTPEVRERMTYREMREVIRAKQTELGLDYATLDHGNKDIRYWLEQIGMAEDVRELITEDHHMDLPLNFNWMPEYEPMLEAETQWWDQQKLGPVDTAPLFAIVQQYAPQPKKD